MRIREYSIYSKRRENTSINVAPSPDMIKKLQSTLKDEAFMESLNSLQTAAEIQIALKDKGIDLDIDEIRSIGEAACAVNTEDELGERELEAITGGSMFVEWGKIFARWVRETQENIRGRWRR